MLLGNEVIKRELKKGNIVIDPFNEVQLQGVSYDIRVGHDFTIPNMPSHEEYHHTLDILIPPRTGVVLTTMETFGAVSSEISCFIKGRSTLARNGLMVTGGAGWGEPGFVGKWGILVYNITADDISIPVGTRIAQAVFIRVEGCSKEYTGVYLNQTKGKALDQ